MKVIKDILDKVKKSLNPKKIIDSTKNFIKTKKLLSILILAAIIASIAVSILVIDKIKASQISKIPINKPIYSISIEPNGSCIYNANGKIYTLTDIFSLYKYSGISNFFLTTVSGAYKITKDYLIYKENLDSLPSNISGTIISDIYSVVPKNGEDVLSMQPIYVTFRLPGTIDKTKADYQIVRISDNAGIIPLKGAYLHSDGSNYYITAKVYHLSKFALKYIGTINVKKEYGLKEVYSVETRGAGRPILVVGGIDKTIYDVDFWMNVFPNRSIWFYYYPTSETRSLSYQNVLNNLWQTEKNYIASKYKITINRNSYIVAQAALLKQDLIAIQQAKKYIHFDIVANGIGGLIVRWALEGLSGKNPIENVKNLYLVDVPNNGLSSVDPNKLKDIYGSSNAFIKKQYSILDIEQVKWFTNRLITMLDNYSPFIQDIIPSSAIIAILNKATQLDKNVNYNNFCGIKPIFNIKYIPGSRIEDDFPLFVSGKGDGKISIYDANIVGEKLITLDSNFLQVYQNKDFLTYVKTGYVDNQEEKIAKLQSNINMVNPNNNLSSTANSIKFYDRNVKVVRKQSVLKQSYSVNYNCSNFRIFNEKKYFIYTSKIVSGTNRFTVNGYITDVAHYNKNIYILDFTRSILYITNENLQIAKSITLSTSPNVIYHVVPNKYGVFYYNNDDRTVYLLDNNYNLKKYIQLNNPVMNMNYSNDRLLIQTKSDIRIFNVIDGNVQLYYNTSKFSNMPKALGSLRNFIYAYLTADNLYIISDSYTLFGINLKSQNEINKISSISEANGKIISIKNVQLLIGNRIISAYKGLERLPWFYKTTFLIADAFEYNNSLYLVSKNANGITVRKMLITW